MWSHDDNCEDNLVVYNVSELGKSLLKFLQSSYEMSLDYKAPKPIKYQLLRNETSITLFYYFLKFEVNTNLKFTQAYAYVCFEVFTAVTMKNGVFGNVTPCFSCNNRRFGGT
jgi:hypothetical protein